MSNDPTNEGHGLNVLQQAGLIKIKANVKLPTVNDITANPKKIKIIEMEAPQTARALGNVTAALVGNDIAADAGLTEKQVIFKEKIDARSKRSINIIAANHADKNNKVYQKVVKAYQTAATEKLIKKVYKGMAFGVWTLDHA
ncbi:MetQ/NlpA family ABC transporter substrate-binding protein [Lapidilactobacillus gannanensis]|uniref:MetQ/NlpA family ABC transporter substrate-binding protein n=1 Tax=Lapidilactobacillus gannanensis TaxID=2486002 RepID=UPI0021F06C38|nr:MetQ/NlpA family ABC transporter substrate-binding protein [Lapidilactobacillus gannanensis]